MKTTCTLHAQCQEPCYNTGTDNYQRKSYRPSYQVQNDMADKLTAKHFLRAIDKHQLRYFLQPIFQSNSNQIAGFEALIRWQYPRLGLLSPQLFMPLALSENIFPVFHQHTLSLIIPLLKKLTKRYPSCYLAMNAPAQFFHQQHSIEHLASMLKSHQIEPEKLVIELPESQTCIDHDTSLRNISLMRQMGIRLALDDFGKEHSNLARIKTINTDILKIDRCFIEHIHEDTRSQAILKAMVDLTYRLNITIIAEGVENQQQFQVLRELGINHIQGYYYGRPQPANYWLKPKVRHAF